MSAPSASNLTRSSRPLRLGIVGAGRHGSRYAQHAAADVEGLELVAICRRNGEQGREQAARYGCEYVSDPRALIARDDIDAVAFVTVPDILPALVAEAAKLGKRLLVEKPVAPDLESGKRMLAAIDDANAYCMSGHTLRFNSVCIALRDAAPSLGRLDSLIFTQRFPPQLQLEWLDDPARSGGGNILHTGVHCFDLIRFLSGFEPRDVRCEIASVHTRKTEDNFAATIRLHGSDAMAMVHCSRSTHSRNGTIELSGEHGQLLADQVHGTLCRTTSEGRTPMAVPEAAMTVLRALQQFSDDAVSGAAPMVDFRDGLKAIAVADACYRSASSGSRHNVEVIS